MTHFNIITNVFDLFFNSVVSRLPNNIKLKVALSLRKLQSEGTLAKVKKTLDWIINSRTLLIALFTLKENQWRDIMRQMINEDCYKPKDLKRLIRKLTHILIVIPDSNAFLKSLRKDFCFTSSR